MTESVQTLTSNPWLKKSRPAFSPISWYGSVLVAPLSPFTTSVAWDSLAPQAALLLSVA